MFDKVDRFLKDVTNLVMFLLSILFIVVLGYLDYLVAQRISFSVFYAVPVACSACRSLTRYAMTTMEWLRLHFVIAQVCN